MKSAKFYRQKKISENFLFGTSSYPNYVGTSTAVAASTNSRGTDNVYCWGNPAASINVIGRSIIGAQKGAMTQMEIKL
jgi:hypothetical protein